MKKDARFCPSGNCTGKEERYERTSVATAGRFVWPDPSAGADDDPALTAISFTFLAAVNQALSELSEEGELSRISEKYFGKDVSQPAQRRK